MNEQTPPRLTHSDCRLWELASASVFSPDTSDAVKQIALSIRETLRLQSQVEELGSVRATLLVNFGPESKDPIIADPKMDTERMLLVVLKVLAGRAVC